MKKLFSSIVVVLVALAGNALAQTFNLTQTLLNPNPARDQFGVSDLFGSAVAVVGNNILVGASGEDTTALNTRVLNAGAVYLFNGNTGTLMFPIYNPTPVDNERIGNSVAGLGNDILVGASGANGAIGEVYLFNGTNGNLIRTFSNPNPSSQSGQTDQFGLAVAAVGSNILIGAPFDDTSGPDAGIAYLFTADGALIHTFFNPTPNGALPGDRFGSSVAGVGSNALIGAPRHDQGSATDAGAAYLYNGTSSDPPKTFLNQPQTASDFFGSSVSGVGINVLIGVPNDDILTSTDNAGAAYLYDTSGALLKTFSNPNPGHQAGGQTDQFGWSVAAFGNNVLVLIGTPFDDNGATIDAGRAYLYDGTTGPPALQEIPNPTPTPAIGQADQFGFTVAASGNKIVIAAPGDDTAGEGAGAAYLFSSNPPPAAHAGGNKEICSGQSATIGGNPTATSGTPPYTYSWNPTAGLDDATAANPDASPTSTTEYTVQVTDDNGSTATDQVIVTVNPLPTANAGSGKEICAGQSATIGGNPTASGGTPPYTYSWTPTTGLNNATAANPNAAPTGTTEYTVEVTDAKGCMALDLVTVTVNPLPTVSISGNDPVVTGTTHTYTANTNASNPGYNWSVGNGTIIGGNTNSTVSLTAGSVGTMIVNLTVTDGLTTCSNSATKNVTVNANTLMANAGNDAAICIGASANLNGTASGGDGSYSFTWAVQSGPNTSSSQFNDPTSEDPIFTPTSAGTYVLRFTVADGVVTPVFDGVQITVKALPTATVSGSTSICAGGSATISAALTGTPPWSLTWSDGVTQSGIDTSPATRSVSPASTRTYTVTSVSNASCTGTSSGSATVTVNPKPVANAGPDKGSCDGQSVAIGGNPTASGGTPPYTYSWTPTTGLNNATAANPLASPTSTTEYTIQVTDARGCTNTDQVLVTVPVPANQFDPTLVVFATNSASFQQGADILSGSVAVNNASPGPVLDSQVELAIGQNVTMPAGFTVKAHRLRVRQGANVASDVFYNVLTNNGAISGTLNTPLCLPLFSALPPFHSAPAGSQNIDVAQNGSINLPAGNYGNILVRKNGKLIFTGGIYNIRSIDSRDDAQLLFNAPSEIRIAEKFDSNSQVLVRPNTGSGLAASDIIFYIAGINGNNGNLGATPKAAQIGQDNTVLANFYVPNGTLWLKQGVGATGAFIGKDVQIGDGVQLALDSFFGNAGASAAKIQASTEIGKQSPVLSSPFNSPTTFLLEQNYPNPFNPDTEIRFALPEASHVVVKIFNILGEEIHTLVDGDYPAGQHVVRWNGQNYRGKKAPSGVYFYQMITPRFKESKRMLLAK